MIIDFFLLLFNFSFSNFAPFPPFILQFLLLPFLGILINPVQENIFIFMWPINDP